MEAQTALLAPLVYRGRGLGVLAAFDHGGPSAGFSEDDEATLRAFAASGATAVALAQTVEHDRLRHSLDAAEAERRRWARELHDETLQGLGGLRVILSPALRRVEQETSPSCCARASATSSARSRTSARSSPSCGRPRSTSSASRRRSRRSSGA